MGSADKSALLNQLKIDKEEPESDGYSSLHLLLAAVVAALISGLAVYFLAPKTEEATEVVNIPKKLVTNPVESTSKTTDFKFSNSEEVLNASGYISARRIATVSAEVMGLITSVRVEEGMKVEDGQILATLDDAVSRVNYNLSQARAEVQRTRIASAEADLLEAQRVLTRYSALGKDSFSSEVQRTRAQADVDKFKSMLASARADLKVASIQVMQQQELLDNHTIRAPFSGVVTVKNAQPGEIVAPSSAGGGFTRTGICTIVDMDSLEIEVDVNEAYIGRVKEGQKVKANLDAYPDWDIAASVIATIPTADRAKATVRVRIKIEEKDVRILPDMGVKVAFLKETTG